MTLFCAISFQLFGNCRRVRLFDMDAEDEEESLYEDKSTVDISGIKLDDTSNGDNKENLSSPSW